MNKLTLACSLFFLFITASYAQNSSTQNLKVRVHLKKEDSPKLLSNVLFETYLINEGAQPVTVFDPFDFDIYWKIYWTDIKIMVGDKVMKGWNFIEYPEKGFSKKKGVNLKPGDSIHVHNERVTLNNVGEYKVVTVHEQLASPPRADVIQSYGDKLSAFAVFKIESDTLRFKVDFPLKYNSVQLPDTVATPLWLTTDLPSKQREEFNGFRSLKEALESEKLTSKLVFTAKDLPSAALLPYFKGVTSLQVILNLGDTLPAEILEMKNLTFLRIDRDLKYAKNSTTPVNIDVLKDISKLKNLKRLEIGALKNQKSPSWLGDMPNLQYLYIAYAFTEYGTEIGKLKNLKALEISAATKLPSSLGQLENIEFLTLNKVSEVPDGMFLKMTKLKKLFISIEGVSKLDLTGCTASNVEIRLWDNGVTFYPKGMETMVNLVDLSMGTHVPDGAEFPKLSACKNLKKLFLFNKAMTVFPEEITQISLLENLSMTTLKVAQLSEKIGNLSNLKTLKFENPLFVSLPQSIGNCVNLETIQMQEGNLSLLPQELKNCKSLKKVFLGGNKVSDMTILTQMPQLEDINLSNNNLSEVPEQVTNLINLINLTLFNNPLVDVPDALGKLPKLKRLMLDKTKVSQAKMDKLKGMNPDLKFGY